jgi:protein-S-isoprenylcysteine O-methyltransferase Ste14
MFLVLNYIFIPYEEGDLIKDFGQEYLDYKKKTRTWL